MDVSLNVRNFLKQRRDRAVGSILGYAEQQVRPKLSQAQWEGLRGKVLEAMNSYHDVVLDLVKSEDGTARNDHLIELLERALRVSEQQHLVSKESIVADQRRQDEQWADHPGEHAEVDLKV